MPDPLITEVLPEERLAKLIILLAQDSRFQTWGVTEMAAAISPYLQLEILDAQHQERILCLSDFYNLRERLVARERDAFRQKSEIIAQILERPEAKPLGIRMPEKERS